MENSEERKKRLHREARRRYYARNKARVNAACTQWFRNNKSRVARTNSRNVNRKIAAYQKSANKRSIGWHISDQEAINCFRSACYYCGADPSPLNGIDRVDNFGEYVDSNTVPCCSTCNTMKGSFSIDAFLAHCTKILNNFND
jgi:hypothetical protein